MSKDWTQEKVIEVMEAEITALRAENKKLRAALVKAIRQHEEGNKGLAHRTLCDAIFGKQA